MKETVAKKEEKMEDEETVEDPALEKLQMVCLETIGKCWPYGSEIQEKYLLDAVLTLSDSLSKLTWNQQLQIIKAFFTLFEK
jgi:hypothetical protein